MIFYNNQLMKQDGEARLFMVDNPTPFTNYDDHEAGIYIHLHNLIERAIDEGEDPIALIEGYLGLNYHEGAGVDEIAAYLMNSGPMSSVLQGLRDHWQTFEPSLPDSSLTGGGMGRQEALRTYAETTLRNYLEALAVYNG